ncbi:MAG: diaminopimelate decarboxylase, partial [Erysipelotrichaceae bacterium]|nr:diaminopimelate decarboxylase [Erysipelotrichaceae bacterium]
MEIAKVPVKALAEQYQTPLYVYDKSALKERLKEYSTFFVSDVFETGVLYASKAFNCKAMISLIDEYGLYLDVVSGGELYTAIRAGYDCSKVFFHGNNKTGQELEMAVEARVGTIVIDNMMEARRLEQLLKEKKKTIH